MNGFILQPIVSIKCFSFDWLCQILCLISVAKWVVRCRSFAEPQSLASIVVLTGQMCCISLLQRGHECRKWFGVWSSFPQPHRAKGWIPFKCPFSQQWWKIVVCSWWDSWRRGYFLWIVSTNWSIEGGFLPIADQSLFLCMTDVRKADIFFCLLLPTDLRFHCPLCLYEQGSSAEQPSLTGPTLWCCPLVSSVSHLVFQRSWTALLKGSLRERLIFWVFFPSFRASVAL